MNKVVLRGNICNKIELKYTNSNTAYTKINLAVKRNYKNQNSEYETDFINCVAYKKTAEFLSQYFQKGSPVLLDGRIQTGSYEDKDGNKRYTTDVIIENVEFLESKKKETSNQEEEPVGNPFEEYSKEIEEQQEIDLDSDFLE